MLVSTSYDAKNRVSQITPLRMILLQGEKLPKLVNDAVDLMQNTSVNH